MSCYTLGPHPHKKVNTHMCILIFFYNDFFYDCLYKIKQLFLHQHSKNCILHQHATKCKALLCKNITETIDAFIQFQNKIHLHVQFLFL